MKALPVTFIIAALFALLAAAYSAFGGVPRPVADFALVGGKAVKAFRGQPVVVIVAPSPKFKLFRKEIADLEKSYQEFASRGAIFIAAFTVPDESAAIKSSIPFVQARDGARVAQICGFDRFGVAVIGKDGNLDLVTGKFAAAYKIRDAILNNFEQQSAERQETAEQGQ